MYIQVSRQSQPIFTFNKMFFVHVCMFELKNNRRPSCKWVKVYSYECRKNVLIIFMCINTACGPVKYGYHQ